MRYRLLDIIVCPDCKNRFNLKNEMVETGDFTFSKGVIRNKHCEHYCGLNACKLSQIEKDIDCKNCFQKEILRGTLVCSSCRTEYPVVNKVPRLLPSNQIHNSFDQVRNRFELQWASWGGEEKIFGRTHSENIDYILKGHSLVNQPEFFKGKLVFDGGCGHGRYLSAFSAQGAETVGIDFGNGIDVATEFNKKDGMVHTVMGDLLNLPIREDCIDYTFSTGVIHHTPDPRRAFTNLSKITKKGGMMFIWVYPLEGPAWEISQKMLRAVLTRIPAKLLYYLCFIPVPLLSFVKTYSSTSLRTATWKQCAQVVYDWYSPKFQFHYLEKDLEEWFDQENFSTLENFYIRTGMAGKKKV